MWSVMEQTKVDKYELGKMAGSLMEQGKTTYDIADLLTKALHNKGIDDSISQKTAQRYLTDLRDDEVKEKQRRVKAKFLDDFDLNLKSDLGAIEEAKEFFLLTMRNLEKDHDGAILPANYDIRVRGAAGEKLLKAVELKLRHGLGDSYQEQMSLDSLLDEVEGVTRGLPNQGDRKIQRQIMAAQ